MIVVQRERWVQIKLPSQERVLVSVTRSGVKIVQLKLGGMIPWRTIWQWARQDTPAADRAMFHLMATAPKRGSLAGTIAAIIERDCRSIDDIRALFDVSTRKLHIVDGVEYPLIDPARPGVHFHISPGMPLPLPPNDQLPADNAPSTDPRSLDEVIDQLAQDRVEQERRARGEKP